MPNEPEILPPAPETLSVSATKPEVVKKSQVPQSKGVGSVPHPEKVAQFSTNYFQILGLSVCSKCGSKKQTDGTGQIVCAIGLVEKGCPMVHPVSSVYEVTPLNS
jgi:hypothetical protein